MTQHPLSPPAADSHAHSGADTASGLHLDTSPLPQGAAGPAHPPVLIIGIGPEARAAAESLELLDRVVYGFVTAGHVPESLELNHVPVLGRLSDGPYRRLLEREQVDYVIAEPSASDRVRLMAELFALTGRHPLRVVHPAAFVSPSADLAAGVLVQAGCTIGTSVRIDALTLVGPGVIIDAEAEVGRACTLQLGVRLGQRVVVEEEAFVGAGANVVSGVRVERAAQVGPSALVMKSVRAGTAVFGVPAAPVANEGA